MGGIYQSFNPVTEFRMCAADDRVLPVMGEYCGWEPPGRQVERGEDFVMALEREVLEASNRESSVVDLACVRPNLGWC